MVLGRCLIVIIIIINNNKWYILSKDIGSVPLIQTASTLLSGSRTIGVIRQAAFGAIMNSTTWYDVRITENKLAVCLPIQSGLGWVNS